jgi:hypothetical protein
MPPHSNLVCKECGHVNETERIYCHGCGAKLDRTVILAQQEKLTISRKEKQRRLKKMMTPGGGSIFKKFEMLVQVLAWALLTALVIQIARPPDGIPPMPKKGEVIQLPQLGDDLERLTAAPAGQGFIFREADINTFLLKKTFRKVPAWFTNLIPLRRTFVNLGDGQARLTVQADLAGYQLYLGITAQPNKDPKNPVSWVGLNFGRVALPPIVAPYAAMGLPILMDSVKRERELLGKLGTPEISKGQVILRSRGPQAAPAAGVPATASPRPAGR